MQENQDKELPYGSSDSRALRKDKICYYWSYNNLS